MEQIELILKGEESSTVEPPVFSFASYYYDILRRANPDSIAMAEADSGRSLSHGQLVTQVQSVAAGLRDVGVLPGDVVAVVSYNSMEANVVSLTAALVGAVAAIVPTSLDPVELAVQLRAVNPRLVFTEDGELLCTVEAALAQFPVRPTVVVNSSARQTAPRLTFQQLLKDGGEILPTKSLYNPNNPVCIMFYSGPSGTPEAFTLSERVFMNLIRSP